MTPLRLSQTLFAVAALLYGGSSHACMPVFPDEEYADEGRNVVIGTVEETYSKARPAGAGIPLTSTNSYSQRAPELLVKVQVTETLRGEAPANVTAVSPCRLPLRAGDRVVVATYYGRRIAHPADMYEDSFRASVANDR